MGFKSLAQKKRCERLLAEGRISRAEFNRMADGTPKDLPEKAEPAKRKSDPNKWSKWPRYK